jgi:ABC-type uncharacterized transport system auxiliary subunit
MKSISAKNGLLAITALVTACGGVMTSEQAARQTYLLEPYSAHMADNAGEAWPPLALSVSVVPGLDTDRIQARGPDARLNHYANARWADFLPEVLSSVLRRSLAATGRFEAVKATPSPDGDDWTLELEVQEFYGVQVTAGSTSSVAAQFEGMLHCKDENHRFQVFSSSPVGDERLSLVVRAHQQALDDITGQLLDQVGESCK